MTIDPAYFAGMYSASPDPWGFTTRWYEQRKYALSLAMLPEQRYGSALEIGCSIGVFTRMLAERCDTLLAWDLSAEAAAQAARRTSGLSQVTVEQRTVPGDWPPDAGGFDLIVASEVLYYFDDADLSVLLDRIGEALRPGGTLLAVHWRHPVTEYPATGDDVHRALAGHAGLARLADHRERDFVAEVYLRGDTALSVAEAEGLV